MYSRLAPAAAALLAAALCGAARADDIKLASGEVLTVKILEVTDTSVKFQHPVLGEMTLPKDKVTILPPPPAQPAAEGNASPQPAAPQASPAQQTPPAAPPPPATPPPPPVPPVPESFLEGWKGKIELGLTGSSGNSENLNVRGAVGGKRMTPSMETTLELSYIYSTSEGDKIKSRGEFDGKNDWIFKDSPWGFFLQGKAEYDEFQDWDWRVSLHAGPSYTVIKDEKTTLRFRAGAGIAKEFGGKRNEIIPEALVGMDFTHKFDDRQSIFLTLEWLPSLSNWPEYRADGKAGYELLIDPATKMYFKAGVNDRYDSAPGDGFKRNDIEYFVTLGWEF